MINSWDDVDESKLPEFGSEEWFNPPLEEDYFLKDVDNPEPAPQSDVDKFAAKIRARITTPKA